MTDAHSHAGAPAGPTDIAGNLRAIREQIAAAARQEGREAARVSLLAVSKGQPETAIRQAIAAGQRLFGENRVQEAEGKWPAIRGDVPDAMLHLIGPLQRNKVRRAVRLFDVIESVDRAELARALAEIGRQEGRVPDVFIQVNTGEEEQKAGLAPADADALVHLCRDELGLRVRGLMCVPPLEDEPSLHFALLREIARRTGLVELSMGMSADFLVAVRFGATLVRLGTAVFGERG